MYSLDWQFSNIKEVVPTPRLAVLKNHRTGFGGFVQFLLSKENLGSLVLTLQIYLEVL
jgi:hypothetical protein